MCVLNVIGRIDQLVTDTHIVARAILIISVINVKNVVMSGKQQININFISLGGNIMGPSYGDPEEYRYPGYGKPKYPDSGPVDWA
jgi:hypothetical protein